MLLPDNLRKIKKKGKMSCVIINQFTLGVPWYTMN